MTTERARRAVKKPVRGATVQRRPEPQQRQPRRAPRRWSFSWLNRLMILLGAGVVLAAGLQGAIKLESIPVQRIIVTGTLQHTRMEVVQEMVQPALAGGFLNADLAQIRTQLEALPWIFQASVRRRWPNALEIDVVEQLPIARWGDSGFLNHEGEVFQSASAEAWRDLPQLAGPEGSQRELMVRYQRLEELLATTGLEVAMLKTDNRGQLTAQLSGGISLVLGGEAFLERVQRFIAAYRADLSSRAGEIERVDMRYQAGLAVAFRETEPAQVAGRARG